MRRAATSPTAPGRPGFRRGSFRAAGRSPCTVIGWHANVGDVPVAGLSGPGKAAAGHVRLGVALMVMLEGASLTIDALAAVAEAREEVALAPAAPLSARRLAEMADLAARVVSLELFVAAQAIDLRRPSPAGRGNRESASPGARTRRLHRPRTDPSGRPRATCRCGPGGPVCPGGQLRLTGHVQYENKSSGGLRWHHGSP